MKISPLLWLSAAIVLSPGAVSASGITYVCGNMTTSSCQYLNNTVAAIYNNTFMMPNMSIYVSVGTTDAGDLSESTYEWNSLSYKGSGVPNYIAALSSRSTVDKSNGALASLSSYDTSVYGAGDIAVTGALGQVLGLSTSTLLQVTAPTNQNVDTITFCTGLSSTCYAGAVTLSSSDSASTDYSASVPGTFNIAAAVEHETDEILGTGSCTAQDGSSQCQGLPSAVDLFRFSGPGQLITASNIPLTSPAYFSYTGGVTNGADGVDYAVGGGNDYADFATGCNYVQYAGACENTVANINTDGPGGGFGPEINILNVLGYNESTQFATPEPGTLSLFSIALGAIALWRRKRV